MITEPIDIFFNLDTIGTSSDGIVVSKTNDSDRMHFFTEGDTHIVRLHLRKNYNDDTSEFYTLDTNNELILLSAEINNAVDDIVHVSYSNEFDLVYDDNNDVCYQGEVSFATESAKNILANSTSVPIVLELVIRDKLFGHQKSIQGEVTLNASLLKGTVKEIDAPSINIGSYSTVVSLANGIVDKRILDLRAGAPVEFDTLYELAEFAQKVRSHEIVVGNYYDYLNGKRLADQNLTVVSLGNLAIDTSTYKVSHEPWRPIQVSVSVV